MQKDKTQSIVILKFGEDRGDTGKHSLSGK